jgi:hypothetical protein
VVSFGKQESERKKRHPSDIQTAFVDCKLLENFYRKNQKMEISRSDQEVYGSLGRIEYQRLSIIQRLILRMGGVLSIERRRASNHELKELFLRRCNKHGIIVTYPQGYDGKLRCWKCAKEIKEQ